MERLLRLALCSIWLVMVHSFAQAADILLGEAGGPLCPDPEAVHTAEEGNQIQLEVDLSSTSPTVTAAQDLTARQSCALHLTLRPGAGQKVVRSVVGFRGEYKLNKLGVGFVSLGQQLADGSATDYLNKTTPGAEEAGTGCLKLDGPLTDWGSHPYGCGQEVPLTLSVSLTARQAVGRDPTSIQGKAWSAAWELSPCSEGVPR